MRLTAIAALAASLQLAGAAAAFAADSSTGTMNGVNHGSGMSKARCTPGDPNVMVDQKNKTFTMDTKAKAPMKGSTSSAAMGDSGMAMGKKSNMVSMCKSEAMSMGAKMTGGTMKKSSM